MKVSEIPDFLRSKGYVFTSDENDDEKFYGEIIKFSLEWQTRCEDEEMKKMEEEKKKCIEEK